VGLAVVAIDICIEDVVGFVVVVVGFAVLRLAIV
jgi:hypothetical protein